MTSKERHTIAIIDDHPLFRRGVRELLDLEQGLDVVGEAGTREEAIKLVRRTEPDLTILDLNMKGCSGVEILSTLKDEDPSRRIVVLTVSVSRLRAMTVLTWITTSSSTATTSLPTTSTASASR